MTVTAPPETAAAAPALGRRSRVLLLAAVAACAACGLVYELALLTLSASLTGGGITETSLIVAGFVAALGLGALAAKPLLTRAAPAFVAVEVVLGLVGGVSAAALYVAFTFLGSSTWVLVLATAAIGMLVGAEVPLLMTLLQTAATPTPPTRARSWPISTPPTTPALSSVDWRGRSCCCRRQG